MTGASVPIRTGAPLPVPVGGDTEPARIGPNAIIQTLAALRDQGGPETTTRIAQRAGCDAWLSSAPSEMVPEGAVIRLFDAVRADSGLDVDTVMRLSGQWTGAYILAHRIPKGAQHVLRALPGGLAAMLLSQAIRQHAWTFAGSGRVTTRRRGGFGRDARQEICIWNNPLAGTTFGCSWHKAVLGTLFEALCDRRGVIRETECCGAGAPACRFEILSGYGSA